jgi:hypothetical protein
MSMSTPIALEIFLGFGVPIGWGLWELHVLRREKENDRAKAAAEATALKPASLNAAAASGTAAASEPSAP